MQVTPIEMDNRREVEVEMVLARVMFTGQLTIKSTQKTMTAYSVANKEY